ncbi:expressed protein, partial [Dictyostelium purpureum]
MGNGYQEPGFIGDSSGGKNENAVFKRPFYVDQQEELFNFKSSILNILQGIFNSKSASRLKCFIENPCFGREGLDILETIFSSLHWSSYFISANCLRFLIGGRYIAGYSSKSLLTLIEEQIINHQDDHEDYVIYYIEVLLTDEELPSLEPERILSILFGRRFPLTINTIRYFQTRTNSLQSISDTHTLKKLFTQVTPYSLETINFF